MMKEERMKYPKIQRKRSKKLHKWENNLECIYYNDRALVFIFCNIF